jgi:SAM-dependent methyltransferase
MPSGPLLDVKACPVCGHDEWTTVSEYNKLLMLEAAIDDAARTYYYSLCHRCGVVFARVRPVGERYRYLFDRFEVVLGRASEEDEIQGGNALRTSARLDEDARTGLRQRLSHGVFVSELSGLRRHDYVPELQQDRIVSSPHIELLGSLLTLKSPRVLELRPRLGAIGAALQRLYGAEVYAMPLFETQQMLIEEAYGIRTEHRLDYEDFSIPYDGCFDLIVANHMFTHAVRPREFLTTLRQRLKPGGHVYLYNESDEAGVLVGGKLLFNNLNAFHFQTFNADSLGRGLAACGFVPTFVSHLSGRLLALASAADGDTAWTPISKKERQKRAAAYQRARDLAILRLPPNLRHLFHAEWDAVVERAVVAGAADYDERGHLRIVKRVKRE